MRRRRRRRRRGDLPRGGREKSWTEDVAEWEGGCNSDVGEEIGRRKSVSPFLSSSFAINYVFI